MKNRNCLENIMCPKCAHTEDFLIIARTLAHVTDDGATQARNSGIEWDDDSYIECTKCGAKGLVENFAVPGFSVTYQTWTPESLEHGEPKSSGWWMPGCWMHDEQPDDLAFQFDPADYDPEEHSSAEEAAIQWAVNLLKAQGATAASCQPVDNAKWWSTDSESLNYATGETITKSFHFTRFADEQVADINQRMAAKNYALKPEHAVYQLCLPEYDKVTGEGLDGVLWLVLSPDEASTILSYAEDLGNPRFRELNVKLDDAGINYDSRVPGQMDALISRLKAQLE